MLPEKHHEHDTKYIQSQLWRLPVAYRVKACDGYSALWNEVYKDDPRNEGEARRTANLRLRSYVEKILNRREEK